MAEERRSAPRARISGARVTYESANGDHTETDALNLARGGLFVRTERPLAVGKRLALEIQVAGELVPWSALGRVVWIREHDDGDRRPAGMGVKLIDVEDSVAATIERLVAGRAHIDGGIDSPPQPALVAPIVSVGAPRERTIHGLGASSFPVAERPIPREAAAPPSMTPEPEEAREPSVVVALVSRSKRAPEQRDAASSRSLPRGGDVLDRAADGQAWERSRLDVRTALAGRDRRGGISASRWRYRPGANLRARRCSTALSGRRASGAGLDADRVRLRVGRARDGPDGKREYDRRERDRDCDDRSDVHCNRGAVRVERAAKAARRADAARRGFQEARGRGQPLLTSGRRSSPREGALPLYLPVFCVEVPVR